MTAANDLTITIPHHNDGEILLMHGLLVVWNYLSEVLGEDECARAFTWFSDRIGKDMLRYE